MVIKHDDLADRPRILKLENGFLLDSQNYNILAAYTDLRIFQSRIAES